MQDRLPRPCAGRVERVPAQRRGAAELDGEGEVALGIGMARHGENPLGVIGNVEAKTEEIAAGLRAGTRLLPVFALESQEGGQFSPLTYTHTVAMAGAALSSLILVCVRGRVLPEARNPLNRFLIALSRPSIARVLGQIAGPPVQAFAAMVERLRPEMMGVARIMWSQGTGSEVMSRIAASRAGRTLSPSILTLAVIPAILAWVKGWKLVASMG